ncbi:tRNA (adenosine(37)-N6)-threonylcarbamoyltransferase complex transferase subunit TsaD [Leptothoe sp. PORK10 BA2]|uniref:tRNA (adenosine(37)-N6)-threonylcarbamoyltransferase complex transferase subunit TsaD n=1 Tax=Leptothoe sp. PORK10 BA2 TaxID=3110254 RepID=UPI002B21C3EB|nr:tRNA (adenosine(37)-N6)-threonylcarbamoyltransferase complex transferase subunit TsaD [Leptothoe sp. PORK10 BA2]MEA5463961.1 tRNA (adenosine(37)-N6)-threonylcarbamoyltransferase complex transferase subunit TsaD [Leptothoe sp. PORK10 BA2]
MATILAIETSCDETAAAVVCHRQVLSSVVASQIDLHSRYGGVVPELASREHLLTIGDTVQEALLKSQLTWTDIDAVATTCAPGLVGALLVGMSVGKTLSMVHQKPFLGAHHLEGHIYAAYLEHGDLQPPFLCLLVSGGHTSLIRVDGCGQYTLLGKTRDDAAGEAFDKVARLLELGYPGGPIIDRLAQQGNPTAFQLPEGNISLPGGGYHPYDASFSGLKTAVLRLVERLHADGVDPLPLADIAASFQSAVVRALTKRAVRAAQDQDLPAIVLGGGVAANSSLRHTLSATAADHGISVYVPSLKFCTDNAAMVACAASDHFDQGHRSSLDLGVYSRLPLEQISILY